MSAEMSLKESKGERSGLPVTAYTSIWKSRDELLTRRVLTQLTHPDLHLGFMWRDGWYSVIVPAVISEERAAALARSADAFAHTALATHPLAVFQEYIEVN